MVIESEDKSVLTNWMKIKLAGDSRPKIALALFEAEAGKTRMEISKKIGYSYRRVCEFIRLYKLGGIRAVTPGRRGRRRK